MFVKKATPAEIAGAKEKLERAFGEVIPVEDMPVREYMIKWLSVFAADMTVYDAKSFCLPKLLYRNYLWHAFSFQKTDCYVDEDAEEAFKNGFEGECYILLNRENLLCKIPDGRVLNPENVKEFDNFIVFTADFSETFVHTGNEEFGPYYKSADMAQIDDSEPEEEIEVEIFEEE
ncbi:MAG: DUF4275 family protein [Ruminococcaceae bacterium]|nr:DUF4275 family protein [Oscillospiraceae bacterium]